MQRESRMTVYKRKYVCRILLKAIALLVLPPMAFWVFVGRLFPPGGAWNWMFWILGGISLWIGFWAAVAQLLGSTFPQWIGWDVLGILDAFEKTTSRTLSGVRDTLPVLGRRLDRSEIQQAQRCLERGRPVLVEGESGSGKSGIAAALVAQAAKSGIPALFLDTRNYSSAVSSFGELEHYVGVEIPLRDCLERTAKRIGGCLLVIDQLDNAVGTPAFQVSTELLAAGAALPSVKVIGVTCVTETPEYEPIRSLGFDVVVSRPLDRPKVDSLLREIGIADPSEAVLTLSENLLCLSLVAELAGKVDIGRVEGEVSLFELYRETLHRLEGSEFIGVVADLAYENLPAGMKDFSAPHVSEEAMQRLQSRGIIIPADRGLCRFRHEQLFHYFYAHKVVDDPQQVDMLARIAGRHIEGALVWMLRLVRHRYPAELAQFLTEALIGSGGLHFFEKAALLDEMTVWTDQGEFSTAVGVVETMLSSDSGLERYFFRRLAQERNVEWFDGLRDGGVFKTPPEPIERDGKVIFSAWPALQYLAAVAPALPKGIVEVAEGIHTHNHFALVELVRVALSMPPEYAAEMVPLVVRWVDEGLQIGKNTASLAIYLADSEQFEAALVLVDLILSPKAQQAPEGMEQSPLFFPKAVTRAERYFVQRFMERELGLFLEQRPWEVLHIVQRNLERVVEIERRDSLDSSGGWRSAIEPHEQNWQSGEIRDLLVDALVQVLDFIIANAPNQGRVVAEKYLAHHWSIFRRIAIHCIRLNAARWPDLLERLFVEKQHLEEREYYLVYHEYWMLMHDTYDMLPPSVQVAFVERLLDKHLSEQDRNLEPAHLQRRLVLRRLWAIKDSLPSDKYSRVLANLVSEYGEPDHPSFLSYTTEPVGTVSPRTSEELSEMATRDVMAELNKGLPVHGVDEPTQEGLAEALRVAIASKPERFAPIAPQLLGTRIPPIYTHYAVRGFRAAWKEGREFEWGPVLELCHEVARTEEETLESGEPPDMMVGYWMTTYASARSAVADLLKAGVARDDNAIPPEFLGQVRDVLLILADDQNPSPEYEQRWGSERPLGLLDLALNVTRGKAVEGLFEYAFHVARARDRRRGTEGSPSLPASRMEDEIREKLTEKLDKQVDPSLTVHSLFGRYLPGLHYLHEGWLVAHLEDIFPRRPEMADHWEAAWDGYLFGRRFHEYLYRILKPYYRHALEQIALGEHGRPGSDFSQGRLAWHLAALYFRDLETFDTSDSLIPLFFSAAPDQTRAAFVQGLEGRLRETRPTAKSEEWKRARTLWETRSRVLEGIAERGEGLTRHLKELGAFAGWVPFIPENLEAFYPMIDASGLASEGGDTFKLIEYLSSVSEDHPRFVACFLAELLDRERGPWFLRARDDIVRPILEVGMRSGDEQARACAVTAINLFGERGNESYRELLRAG